MHDHHAVWGVASSAAWLRIVPAHAVIELELACEEPRAPFNSGTAAAASGSRGRSGARPGRSRSRRRRARNSTWNRAEVERAGRERPNAPTSAVQSTSGWTSSARACRRPRRPGRGSARRTSQARGRRRRRPRRTRKKRGMSASSTASAPPSSATVSASGPVRPPRRACSVDRWHRRSARRRDRELAAPSGSAAFASRSVKPAEQRRRAQVDVRRDRLRARAQRRESTGSKRQAMPVGEELDSGLREARGSDERRELGHAPAARAHLAPRRPRRGSDATEQEGHDARRSAARRASPAAPSGISARRARERDSAVGYRTCGRGSHTGGERIGVSERAAAAGIEVRAGRRRASGCGTWSCTTPVRPRRRRPCWRAARTMRGPADRPATTDSVRGRRIPPGEVDRLGRLEDHVPAGARASAQRPPNCRSSDALVDLRRPARRCSGSSRGEPKAILSELRGSRSAPPPPPAPARPQDADRDPEGGGRLLDGDRSPPFPSAAAGVDVIEPPRRPRDDGTARVDDRLDPEEVVRGIAVGEDFRSSRPRPAPRG